MGNKRLFRRKNIDVYMPSGLNEANDLQEKFGELAAKVQKYKGQGEVMSVGDYIARNG